MKIITFYSFKGGVGRTALLMHLAIQWADRGAIVAVVDMDLQAPGLSFHPWLQAHSDPKLQERGMSDLLSIYYSEQALEQEPPLFGFYPPSKLLREVRDPSGKWGSGGRLYALPAGGLSLPQADHYEPTADHHFPADTDRAERTTPPPAQRTLHAFADRFRKDLEQFKTPDSKRPIDLLLIDSRTGYLEMEDLAVGYLADQVVLISGLNGQNLRGLALTLKALRPQRIPAGQFANQALCVFSPVPAHLHDDPAALAALQTGYDLLEEACIQEEGLQEELPPKVFTLPYTPHLAISDIPLPRGSSPAGAHPYWQSVVEIANALLPQQQPEQLMAEQRQETIRTLGLHAHTPREPRSQEGPYMGPPLKPSSSNNRPLANLFRLPKWDWPFKNSPDLKRTWLSKVPSSKGHTKQFEPLLNGLCISLSLKIEEKKKIFDNLDNLSLYQQTELVKIFQEEQYKLSSLDVKHEEQLFTQLFEHQRAWAGLMLESPTAGDRALLEWPLEGTDAFIAWRETPYYWRAILENVIHGSDLLKEARHATLQAGIKRAGQYIHKQWKPHSLQGVLSLIELIHQHAPDLTTPLLERVKTLADLDHTGTAWRSVAQFYQHVIRCDGSASSAYEQALAKNPQDAWTAADFAQFLAQSGKDLERAEALYQQAIEVDPNDAGILNNFALFMTDKKGDHAQAEILYNRAIEADPNDAIALGNFAHFMTKIKSDHAQAEILFNRAIKANPNHAKALGNFATVMTKIKSDHAQTEILFNRAIEADPNDAKALGNFATFMTNIKGDHAQAEILFNRAIEADPNNANNLGNFAHFMTNIKGDHAQAERLYNRAIEADPNHANNLGNFALFMTNIKGDHAQAEILFNRAIEADPNHANNLGNFAHFMTDKKGDHARAEILYTRAIEADPNNAKILNNFANFMTYIKGDHTQAEILYNRAIEAAPNNANALGNFALFMTNIKGDHAQAEILFNRAIEADPNHANNLGNFAWFLLGRGRLEEGRLQLEKSLSLQQEEADPTLQAETRFYQYALGPAHQRSEALAVLRRVLMEKQGRSPGWDFAGILEQAEQRGHPHYPWLIRLAQVISAGAPVETLEPWPDTTT
ncbi:Tetratricopeptide domain protein [Magnetococcus marinus MC-1]|uniref:Tetratricopeptide domain protein n=1 Tax=Magnetococcus marinus (strain ATCC BAA-1437 / JCM 17883 / MC-1) TaxID=156889 RepID=A0LCU9_MAGMM|nr:tetratricopeptide repeat protein [Magnetococcus marinus]ABK45792.1 Tetratricopeptide domain protein [Magnetococcus marinus MC-1]